jgi:Polyketide cyclase / dehydrase and lipid transport
MFARRRKQDSRQDRSAAADPQTHALDRVGGDAGFVASKQKRSEGRGSTVTLSRAAGSRSFAETAAWATNQASCSEPPVARAGRGPRGGYWPTEQPEPFGPARAAGHGKRYTLVALRDQGERVDINEDAPVITRDEIVIQAPIRTIWEIQTDVNDWPSWQPDVERAESDGPLQVGSVFRWQTAGLDITATIEEIDAPRRIVWGGPAQGIVAVHVWTLEPQDDGILVRTAESWEGEPVEAQVETLQGALDGSLRAWLENLKRTAEQRAGGG